MGLTLPWPIAALPIAFLPTCACSGAVGELLTVDLAESWSCIETARDVSQTEGKHHTSISHDVRGVINPSECGADQLAALVPLHPVEGTTKRELFFEAKYTSFNYHRGQRGLHRLTACCCFGSDPTGTLVVTTIVLRSARCMVQLAMAGSEVQAGIRGSSGTWDASVAWNPRLESLGLTSAVLPGIPEDCQTTMNEQNTRRADSR